MSPYNIGCLALKHHNPYFISCTPLAVQELILSTLSNCSEVQSNPLTKFKQQKPLKGKKVCIIGRSNIVGMPLNLLLLQRHDASVKVCHSRTTQSDLIESVADADIVVACCGVPTLVKGEWLKEGATVIDVGITYKDTTENQAGCEIFGDVNFDEVTLQKVSRITPVPGGVGPMTITMLMNNVTHGWVRQNFDLILNDTVYRAL